ncbi:hypothetical protein FHS96_005824 [Sphingomonas zeicaulis]|uniref:hypothetical protein n=1 Tax=Sphingomonas zeicaulis TaxID=1632740 RepID=UPI003D1E21F9
MSFVSPVSLLVVFLAPAPLTPSSAKLHEMVAGAVNTFSAAQRCTPAVHPGGGPGPAYYELVLLKARLNAAVRLMNQYGEIIDIKRIEEEQFESEREIMFMTCRGIDVRSLKNHRKFKKAVERIEVEAVNVAAKSNGNIRDHDGDGIVSTLFVPGAER